jgi:hypothetical protein
MGRTSASAGLESNGNGHPIMRHHEYAREEKAAEETPGLRTRVPGSPLGSEANPPALPDEPEVAVNSELAHLRAENTDLLLKVSKLEQLVAENAKKAQFWAEQHRDHERLLEEKSDVIRELHAKLQQVSTRPTPASEPTDKELLLLEEELERERRQLKDDEETLMQQMREMEVQMSRERAELARQRNDLQRLHSEIRHELELASREAELRDRLMPLQRRYQEMTHRKGAEPPRGAAPAPATEPADEEPQPQQVKGSGLLRRLFG